MAKSTTHKKKSAPKKEVSHPKESVASDDSKGYDNLYIALNEATEKRKNILYCIKNSLMVQEEYEKIFEMRKEKTKHINQIKREMESLNASYQKLRKLLPNVKNALAHTEKELNGLNQEVETLIKKEEPVFEEEAPLGDIRANFHKELEEELTRMQQQKSSAKPKKEEEKISKPEKLTRLDRIKNNLQVIESKLNQI